MVANPNELGPRIEETQKKTPEKKQNPFSQEAITTQLAKEPDSVKSMTAKHIKSPELKTYSEKKETELKVILEGKENSEKSPEKVKADIVDGILKEKLGDKKYEQYIKTGYTKEVLREKYLASNEKELVVKNKDGKEIKTEKYEKVLENNKSFAKLDTKENPQFTKELLSVYGIDEIEGYEGLIETAGKRGEKLPTTLEEFDKFIDEKFEYAVSPNNSSKEDIGKDINNFKNILAKNPNSDKKNIIETLLSFLNKLFNFDGNYNEYYNKNGGTLPEGLDKMPSSIENMLKVGMSQIGVNEHDGSADKYLQEIGHKGRKSAGNENAWCAAFVNWTLMKSGMDYNSSLASQSFINGSGKGHVGFKVGNQLLGGNQSDMVSLKPLNLNKVQGWVMPDNRGEIHRKGDKDFNKDNIPDGAILVFTSSKNTR